MRIIIAVTLTLLLCLLTIHHPPNFCTAHSDSEVRCIESERHALLNFKQHLTDPSNRLASWVASASDVDCCHWVGVVCDNRTGYVLQLHLRSHYPVYDELTIYEEDQRDAQYEAYSRSRFGDHGQGRQRVQSERTICNQRKLEKEGLDEVRFMVDVNLMGISNMLKEAFPTMKNWRDCGSCPPRPVSVYLWASWFDRGVAIGGLFPLTFKSLIFPPDIDTPGLVERLIANPWNWSYILALLVRVPNVVLTVGHAIIKGWNWDLRARCPAKQLY